jgi:hypothetical protein
MPSLDSMLREDKETMSSAIDSIGKDFSLTLRDSAENAALMIQDLQNMKWAWDSNDGEINSAKYVYRMKDLLDLKSKSNSLTINELEDAVKTFEKSFIAKSSSKINGYVGDLKNALSSLKTYNAIVETYRIVKPIVKTAVNIGGIVWNFANAKEIAQDVLQYVLREFQGKVRDFLLRIKDEFMNLPIFIITKGSSFSDISAELILDSYLEMSEKANTIALNAMKDLSYNLDSYLEMVRKMNDFITNETGVFDYKDFVAFSQVVLHDICCYDDFLFIATKNNGIIRYKNKEETLLINVEATNIFVNDGILYYATYSSGTSSVFSQEDIVAPIFTVSGEVKKLIFYDNEIIALTENSIRGETYSYSTSGTLYDICINDNVLYFAEENTIKKIYDATEVETLVSYGDKISSLASLENELYASVKEGSYYHIKKYRNEPEFLKKTSYSYGFTFIKEINGTIYASKKNSLFTLSYTDPNFTETLVCNNLPTEISGLEKMTVSFSGTPTEIFVISAGQNIFVADSLCRIWEEKYLDFQGIGENPAIIQDILYIPTDGLYIASGKNVYKIQEANFPTYFSFVIPLEPSYALSGDYSIVEEEPENIEGPEDAVIIPITITQSYDDLVYSFVKTSPISVAHGNTISNSSIIAPSNIYTACSFSSTFLYPQGKKMFFEDNKQIQGIQTEKTILSVENTSLGVVIFTDLEVFLSSGVQGVMLEVKNEAKEDATSLTIFSSGTSLFSIVDNTYIFHYNPKEDEKIFSLIQKLPTLQKIVFSNFSSYAFDSNFILYNNFKNNAMHKSKSYHNGYLHTNSYKKRMGVASYDYHANVLKYSTRNKAEYTELLKPSFAEEFEKLVKTMPEVISQDILEKIQEEQFSITGSPTKEEQSMVSGLKEEIKSNVKSMLKSVFQTSFGAGLEEYSAMASSLSNKLQNKNTYDITSEFYYTSFGIIAKMLQDAIITIQGSTYIDLALTYYERHKAEWANLMISKILVDRVKKTEYKDLASAVRYVELQTESEIDTLLNVTALSSLQAIATGKTGDILPDDKALLEAIIPNLGTILFEEQDEFETWEDVLETIVTTIYRVKQSLQYEDIVDTTGMEPIQWQELPSDINKEDFLEQLEAILDVRRETIKQAINLLVNLSNVPCYSCVTAETAIIKIKKDINRSIQTLRSVAQKKIKNSKTYEQLPNSFYIHSLFGIMISLPTILDEQSALYAQYLGRVIDIIINQNGVLEEL